MKPLLLALFLAVAPLHAAAQDFAGLTIGGSLASGVPALGPPARQGPANPGYFATLWVRSGGAELSVTTDQTGRIVYMESFRGRNAPPSIGQGVRFGATSRAELIGLAGSEGWYFPGRGPQRAFEGNQVFFHSYTLADRPNVMVTFVFRGRLGSDPGGALLESVILAEQAYQSQIWGGPALARPGSQPLSLSF